MKNLQKLLVTTAMVISLSLAVSAQKEEPKKPPPKGEAPVVVPKPKNPKPKETPKQDKPNKPEFAIFAKIEEISDLA